MVNKIPIVTFKNNTLDNIVKGLAMEQVQQVVYDRFIPTIKQAIDKDKKECVLCFVEDYQIVIPKSSYKQTLNTLEKYYLSKEDFDKCSLLRDLALKIKE